MNWYTLSILNLDLDNQFELVKTSKGIRGYYPENFKEYYLSFSRKDVYKGSLFSSHLRLCFSVVIRENRKDLIDFFISKEAADWNSVLYEASLGGHKDLVDFFILQGASDWNWALSGASEGGHR